MYKWPPSLLTVEAEGAERTTDPDSLVFIFRRIGLTTFAVLNLTILAAPLAMSTVRILIDLTDFRLDYWLFWIVLFVALGLWKGGEILAGWMEPLWDEGLDNGGIFARLAALGIAAGMAMTVLGLLSMLVIETHSLLFVCAAFASFGLAQVVHAHTSEWDSPWFAAKVAREAVAGARQYLFAVAAGGLFVLWSESVVVVLSLFSSSAPLLWTTTVGSLHLPKPTLGQMAGGLAGLVAMTAFWPHIPWVKRALGWHKKYGFAAMALTFVSSFSLAMGTAEERNALFVVQTYRIKPMIREKECKPALASAEDILRQQVIPYFNLADYQRLDALFQRPPERIDPKLRLEAAATRLSEDIVSADVEPPGEMVPEEAEMPEDVLRSDAVLGQTKEALVKLMQQAAKEHLGHTLNAEPLSFFVSALVSNVAQRIARHLPDSTAPLYAAVRRWKGSNEKSWDAAERSYERGLTETLPEIEAPRFPVVEWLGELGGEGRARVGAVEGAEGERLPIEEPKPFEFPIEAVP